MSTRWALEAMASRGRNRGATSFHRSSLRAVQAAAGLWRVGLRPARLVGPLGEKFDGAEIEAAAEAISHLEMNCEACGRTGCDDLLTTMIEKESLSLTEFIEAVKDNCDCAVQYAFSRSGATAR